MEKHDAPAQESLTFGKFVPVAYFDKHMDCIRVITHDRSVTEHRFDHVFTLHECNNRGPFDPQYVGFTIKGIRNLFSEAGLSLDGPYKLAELIDKLVSHQPGSTMSEMLKFIYKDYAATADLEVDFADAA